MTNPFEMIDWAEALRHCALPSAEGSTDEERDNQYAIHLHHHAHVGVCPLCVDEKFSLDNDHVALRHARGTIALTRPAPHKWLIDLTQHYADQAVLAELDLWRQASEESLRRLNASS